MGRRSVFVPDEDGNITDERQNVVILLLGAKSNHPFGLFAPRFMELGGWLQKMSKQFDEANPPKGFLGQTSWERKDENGGREFNFISYWRSIEDLHDYAHSPLHKEAWMWWEKTLKENNAMGINVSSFISSELLPVCLEGSQRSDQAVNTINGFNSTLTDTCSDETLARDLRGQPRSMGKCLCQLPAHWLGCIDCPPQRRQARGWSD